MISSGNPSSALVVPLFVLKEIGIPKGQDRQGGPAFVPPKVRRRKSMQASSSQGAEPAGEPTNPKGNKIMVPFNYSYVHFGGRDKGSKITGLGGRGSLVSPHPQLSTLCSGSISTRSSNWQPRERLHHPQEEAL